MSLLDDILSRAGVTYEDLNKAEQATLDRMLESVNKNEITVDKIREYIKAMRESVSEDLAKQSMKRPSFYAFMFKWRKDYLLKARLRNYILLEAFLDSPTKAKKAIEEMLSGMGRRRI